MINTTPRRFRRTCAAVGVLCAALWPLAGCFWGGSKADHNGHSGPDGTTAAGPLPGVLPGLLPMTITMDGSIDDWPVDAAALADEHYLYIRFRTDRSVSLLSSDETVQIQIDVDADPKTGLSAGDMGMDLALTFSPLNEQGQGRGARVEIVTPSGELVSLPPASLDLITAPTHASDWFEARLARRLPGEGLLPVPGLLSTGRAAGRVVLLGPGGRLLAAADPFRVELVPAAAQPRRATLEIPPRPVGALRVVSLNVENSAPDTTPEPFTRMLRVLDPDVVLIQEWYDQTPETLQTWFNSHMPIAGTWSAVTSQGRGVAVVSRLPIEPLGPGGVSIATDDDVRTVRSASALVQTPGGPVALTSVHLKCCGSVGSPEDQQRQIEARAIAGMLADALGQTQAVGVVIGGDLNLVGGVEPLTLLGEGLDPAGGFLRTAEPMVLGEPVMYTWTDPASEFLPGRLDYVLYSGSAMELQRAAVLDPARLSDPVLLATNVQPTDGAASDHRPVVCDFRFRSPQAR